MRKRMFAAVISSLLALGTVSGQSPAPVKAGEWVTIDGLEGYQKARKLAESGERVVLILGTDDSLLQPGERVYRYTRYTECDALRSLVAGVYESTGGRMDDGLPAMVRRVPAPQIVQQFAPAPGPQIVQPRGVQLGITGPLGNTVQFGLQLGGS